MARKPKWTSEDKAALETLVKRHGAAAINHKAKALESMKPKETRGRPAGNAGDAAGIWIYIRFRQEQAKRARSRLTIDGACKLLAYNLEVATLPPHWSWLAIRTLFYQHRRHLNAHPSEKEIADARVAQHLEAARGHKKYHPLPLKLKRDGDGLTGPSIDTWAIEKLR